MCTYWSQSQLKAEVAQAHVNKHAAESNRSTNHERHAIKREASHAPHGARDKHKNA